MATEEKRVNLVLDAGGTGDGYAHDAIVPKTIAGRHRVYASGRIGGHRRNLLFAVPPRRDIELGGLLRQLSDPREGLG